MAERANVFNLGLSCSASQLFYSIAPAGSKQQIHFIGKVDFTESLDGPFRGLPGYTFESLFAFFKKICGSYSIGSLRLVSSPQYECWTCLNKLAFDEPKEREAYISALWPQHSRTQIAASWFELSNRDYRLLALRDVGEHRGIKHLAVDIPQAELLYDFEISLKWVSRFRGKGSFLLLRFYPGCLSVSSIILGQLRGVTVFTYDNLEDLTYEWLNRSRHLSWMNGIHDEVIYFGYEAQEQFAALNGYVEQNNHVQWLHKVADLAIEVEEQTYGFDFSRAIPAILASLD